MEPIETGIDASNGAKPKKKGRHARQGGKFKEITTHTCYSGERSPHWEFAAAGRLSEGGELREHPRANPDVLSDEQSIYHQTITNEVEQKIEAIKSTIPTLSPQQQNVIWLCGIEGRTMREAATVLGMALSTVQTLLTRARKKIIRRYEEGKEQEESW